MLRNLTDFTELEIYVVVTKGEDLARNSTGIMTMHLASSFFYQNSMLQDLFL